MAWEAYLLLYANYIIQAGLPSHGCLPLIKALRGPREMKARSHYIHWAPKQQRSASAVVSINRKQSPSSILRTWRAREGHERGHESVHQKKSRLLDVTAHDFNASTGEAETGRSISSGLHGKTVSQNRVGERLD